MVAPVRRPDEIVGLDRDEREEAGADQQQADVGDVDAEPDDIEEEPIEHKGRSIVRDGGDRAA